MRLEIEDRIRQNQQMFLEFMYQHRPETFEYIITEINVPAWQPTDILCEVSFTWRRIDGDFSEQANWSNSTITVSKERFNAWLDSRKVLDFTQGREPLSV